MRGAGLTTVRWFGEGLASGWEKQESGYLDFRTFGRASRRATRPG